LSAASRSAPAGRGRRRGWRPLGRVVLGVAGAAARAGVAVTGVAVTGVAADGLVVTGVAVGRVGRGVVVSLARVIHRAKRNIKIREIVCA
jgi:hypothetical protein